MVKFMLEVSIGGRGGGVIGDINSYYYLYIQGRMQDFSGGGAQL